MATLATLFSEMPLSTKSALTWRTKNFSILSSREHRTALWHRCHAFNDLVVLIQTCKFHLQGELARWSNALLNFNDPTTLTWPIHGYRNSFLRKARFRCVFSSDFSEVSLDVKFRSLKKPAHCVCTQSYSQVRCAVLIHTTVKADKPW